MNAETKLKWMYLRVQVGEWGMSDKVGRVVVSEPDAPSFMGLRMLQRPTQWGNKMAGVVEAEVERLVNNSYIVAKSILQKNKALLEHLAQTLIEQEVVSAEEFQMMLVKFKSQTIDYRILGEDRNRGKLPFQNLPKSI